MLGDGYARANPQVVSAMMIAASLDWAAMTIAAALVAEEETVPHKGPAWCGRNSGAAMRLSVDVTFDPLHGYAAPPIIARAPSQAIAFVLARRRRGPGRRRTVISFLHSA